MTGLLILLSLGIMSMGPITNLAVVLILLSGCTTFDKAVDLIQQNMVQRFHIIIEFKQGCDMGRADHKAE